MFQSAYAVASQFTKPVVISRKNINGDCSSGIGAFIVVNDDGWILTAHHIVDWWVKLQAGAKKTREHGVEEARIRAEFASDQKNRKKQLSKLGHLDKDATDRCSVWWGVNTGPPVRVPKFFSLPAADIAIGKLDPFDKSWISTYPTFKDPGKNFLPGKSLCKLGFPFHQITPTWDSAKDGFVLPVGALPLPFFPIEGILTRFADARIVGAPTSPPFPIRFVETSSPGLKGQSGGPIFDVDGTIWAMQSRTHPLSLGFDPLVPTGKPGQIGQKEHQFLNVGLGTHVDTILNFFKVHGVAAKVSES